MSADSDAFKAVQQIPGLTPEEQQYLLTVARGEGFYGLGWGNPGENTVLLSEQLGIDPVAGVGSNNWGGIQGVGNAGSFPHIDHHADGTPYVGTFRKYKTSADGAADMARILLKPNIKAALLSGFYTGAVMPFNPTPAKVRNFELRNKFSKQTTSPLRAAVYTQQDNGYFELNPEEYLKAVTRNYGILTQNLKWSPLLLEPPKLPGMIAATPLAGSPSSVLLPPSSGEPSTSNATIRLGSSGELVRFLQKTLTKRGHPLTVDGKFGRLTQSAVRHFQKNNRLTIDGVVGPLTWTKLIGE